MKKLLVIAFLVLGAAPARAQSVTQVFVTNVAAIAPPLDLSRVFVDTHTLQWRVTGTANACAVQIDGSSDGITWTAGGVMASQTCTANGEFSQASTITNFARIDVTALSGASVTFVYVASSSVVASRFSTTVLHVWGPGVSGTGAAQVYVHPTGGSNNQYVEIQLESDPALTQDRNLFNICASVPGNSCIGVVSLGADNDQHVVMSWGNTTLAIVGAQLESEPLELYTPTQIKSGNSLEYQQSTLANSCVFFSACNGPSGGAFAQFAVQDTGINALVCANGWDSVGHAITSSCEPNTVYNHSGAIQNNEATHIVQDTVTLAAGTATVTLTAPAAFLSATSFTCTANDQTANASVKVTQTSGTSLTFTGTGTDVLRFICIGA